MSQTIPLALFGGLANDESVWDAVAPGLAAQREVSNVRTDRHDSIAAAGVEFARELKSGRIAVAGFSHGGHIALELCRQLGERIAGLALICCVPEEDTPAGRAMKAVSNEKLDSGESSLDAVVAAFIPRLFHARNVEDPRLVQKMYEMSRAVGVEGFVRQQTASAGRPDSRETLKQMTCPVLMVAGLHDPIAPAAKIEAAARTCGSADFVLLDDCGHMAPLEAPEKLSNALSSWLARVDRLA